MRMSGICNHNNASFFFRRELCRTFGLKMYPSTSVVSELSRRNSAAAMNNQRINSPKKSISSNSSTGYNHVNVHHKNCINKAEMKVMLKGQNDDEEDEEDE